MPQNGRTIGEERKGIHEHIVPIKVLADDQDIVVAADRSLDDSKAHRIVSTYDLNAIEAACSSPPPTRTRKSSACRSPTRRPTTPS